MNAMFQNRQAVTIILLLVATLAGGMAGCASSSQALIDNPLPIDTSEYDPIFQAAVMELQDRGYRLDQQNYRFGVITTQVQPSPTALEPWHAAHYTPAQAVGSTLNYQRRRISVHLKPAPPQLAGDDDGTQAASPQDDPGYVLEVKVEIQQVEAPLRHLTGSTARGRMFRDDRQPTAAQMRQGVRENYWRVVGRDHELENQLVADIIRRSIDLARLQYASWR